VIMGRPGYGSREGSVVFNGEDITDLTPDERAKRGCSSRCSTRPRSRACRS
jgi:Fe-S cluster assembly ATPase SufC